MKAENHLPSSKRYVYSIRDERGEVLYVGVTLNISMRLVAHRNADTELGKVIRKYEAEGRKLFYRIECETTYAYALETEKAFIAMYERLKLLNVNKRIARQGRVLPKCPKRVEKWNAYLAAKEEERKKKRESKATQESC